MRRPALLAKTALRAALRAGDWDAAAQAVEDDEPWNERVKSRAPRIARVLRTGEWPSDVAAAALEAELDQIAG